jgi:hypothetical protein
MDPHTRPKMWQDIEDFAAHIAVEFHCVSRVDQQDVSRFQLLEKLQWHSLESILNQMNREASAVQAFWERLDTVLLAGATLFVVLV